MKVTTCPCGELLVGETDEEFVATVNAHFAAVHPDLVGEYSDAAILSRAKEVPSRADG